MDPVAEIKARLPIDQLVGQYCQLAQKGRNFVSLCPFHNDTHPSFLVSPDKGIAYCFACQNGGDVFSFYQAIEGVDFRQALKELAEKTGVEIPDHGPVPGTTKDEKERLRECIEAAHRFYRSQLAASQPAREYLQSRGVPADQTEQFGLGLAPDSFSDTYQHLLKEGFSRKEIIAAGLGVQKDLNDERIYDRFRNRLMFPIHDAHGKLVAFGGRTLGEDDAKYINSSESPLYRKAQILYGYHYAKDAIRDEKKIVMVEGYFDVLACHRAGIQNVVAVSGTALTTEHVAILKRNAETIVLCLDQDRAGQDAAERAFHMCSMEGLLVLAVGLPHKDPDETAAADPALLKRLLQEGGLPYVEHLLQILRKEDLSNVAAKRSALQRVLTLLQSIPTAVEREHYLAMAAGVLGTTETALKEDMARLPSPESLKKSVSTPVAPAPSSAEQRSAFTALEITLGLFLLYPGHRSLLTELIEPEDGFPAALYAAIKELPEDVRLEVDALQLPPEFRERAGILQLYCEHHGFADWSENLAVIELRKNCQRANQDLLRMKQRSIAQKLIEARAAGAGAEEAQLQTQYQQVLKLAKMTQ